MKSNQGTGGDQTSSFFEEERLPLGPKEINDLEELKKLYTKFFRFSNLNSDDDKLFDNRDAVIRLINFDITPLKTALHLLELEEGTYSTLFEHFKNIWQYQQDLKTFYDDQEKFCETFKNLLTELNTLQLLPAMRGFHLGIRQPLPEPSWLEKNWKKIAVGTLVVGVVAAATVLTMGAFGLVAGSVGIAAAIGTVATAGVVSVGMAADIEKEKKLKWKHIGGIAIVGMALAVASVFTFGVAGVAVAGFGFTGVAAGLSGGALTTAGAGVGMTLGIGLAPAFLAFLGRTIVDIKNIFSRTRKVKPEVSNPHEKENKSSDEMNRSEGKPASALQPENPALRKRKQVGWRPEIKDPDTESLLSSPQSSSTLLIFEGAGMTPNKVGDSSDSEAAQPIEETELIFEGAGMTPNKVGDSSPSEAAQPIEETEKTEKIEEIQRSLNNEDNDPNKKRENQNRSRPSNS